MCLFNSVHVLVSIGRRLQDPLAELVKIEPKHLGIGMYQVSQLPTISQITGPMFRIQRLSSDLVLKSRLQMTREMTDYKWLLSCMPLTELITIVTLSDTLR